VVNSWPLRDRDTWQISKITGSAWFDPIQKLWESGSCNNQIRQSKLPWRRWKSPQQIAVEMVQAVRIESWFRRGDLGQPDPDQQLSHINTYLLLLHKRSDPRDCNRSITVPSAILYSILSPSRGLFLSGFSRKVLLYLRLLSPAYSFTIRGVEKFPENFPPHIHLYSFLAICAEM